MKLKKYNPKRLEVTTAKFCFNFGEEETHLPGMRPGRCVLDSDATNFGGRGRVAEEGNLITVPRLSVVVFTKS